MRIYDTFPFDGELDLLEHRLKETYDLVDVFVLVEAAETYRGEPKPLHFQDSRERFAWAAAKLRPVSLPQRPNGVPWEREHFQRNAVLLGLRDASPEDIVLILDADEIMSRSALEAMRANGLDGPHRLSMTRHYARFDLVAPRSTCCPSSHDPFPFAVERLRPESWDDLSEVWHGNSGVAARFRDLAGDAATVLPPRCATDLRSAVFMPRLAGAGRHLNAIESSEQLRAKLSHLPHVEHAAARSLLPQHLLRAKRYGLHHLGWWYAEQPSGPLPDDLMRLRQRLPPALAGCPLPHPLLRRAARTWFWMRTSTSVAEVLVRAIDTHFEALLPLLLLPLLIADKVRQACASYQASRREMRYRASQPALHPHW